MGKRFIAVINFSLKSNYSATTSGPAQRFHSHYLSSEILEKLYTTVLRQGRSLLFSQVEKFWRLNVRYGREKTALSLCLLARKGRWGGSPVVFYVPLVPRAHSNAKGQWTRKRNEAIPPGLHKIVWGIQVPQGFHVYGLPGKRRKIMVRWSFLPFIGYARKNASKTSHFQATHTKRGKTRVNPINIFFWGQNLRHHFARIKCPRIFKN